MSHKLSHEQASKEMEQAGLTPLEPYPGNKAKWLCRCNSCGSEVSPSLGSVRTNGGGCRKCGLERSASKRRIPKVEVIEFMIASGVEPISEYPGANSAWLCRCNKCKREVTPRYSNVRNGSSACVYCAGKKLHPDDASAFMKLNNLLPLVPYPGSQKAWSCKCMKCGDIVSPMYASIQSGQGGCKRCGYEINSKKQLGDEEDAIEFMTSRGLTPLEPYRGSGKPWLCLCSKCGEEIKPTLNSIKSGSGCAVCGKRQIVPAKAVEIMIQGNLKPLVDFPGGKQHWKCECLLCGKIVSPKYTDIQSGYGGCKYCGGQFVEPESAERLMKSQGLIPQTPYAKSMDKWHCVCSTCNRDVYTSYNTVKTNKSGCAYCAKRKVDPLEALETMKSVGVTPLIPYPGARVGWQSTCNKCGLEVYPIYSSVKHQHANPCVFCAGKKVDSEAAFNLMLAADLTPLEGYLRADRPWRCNCNKCGRLVTPTYTSIRIGQGGCKYCTNKGLDYSAPAFLYLMVNAELSATKIGVGNHKTRVNRIAEHERNGWKLEKRIELNTGDIAFSVEQATLLWIRDDLGLKPCLTPKQMPQGGYTETFDSQSLDNSLVWEKILGFVEVLAT